MAKKEYERIQLLATPEIYSWWQKRADDPDRQEKLRQIIRIGMEVEEGSLATIDPAKLKIYDAIETLLKSGLLPTAGSVQDPSEEKSVTEKKRPKIDRVKSSINSHRQ